MHTARADGHWSAKVRSKLKIYRGQTQVGFEMGTKWNDLILQI